MARTKSKMAPGMGAKKRMTREKAGMHPRVGSTSDHKTGKARSAHRGMIKTSNKGKKLGYVM